MKRISFDLTSIAVLTVALWLCAFFVAHAVGMLTTGEVQILKYQNILSKEPIDSISKNIVFSFRIVGGLLLVSALLLIVSFVKLEFKKLDQASLMKWGLLTAIIAGTIYGGIMRVVGNQQGAALLYFFTMLLYLLVILNELRKPTGDTLYNSVVLLPLYAVLFYTMGMPGWAKLFGGPQVIERYVMMFKESFVSELPGGTPAMIYMLGVLELSVPLLLIVSVILGEFKINAQKTWLNNAMLLSIFTFGMLCFGLAVLYNFAGSANLVFYPILALLVLLCINKLQNKPD